MKSKNIDEKTIKAVLKGLKPLYRSVFRLMMDTGLRVGDAVNCKYSDIDAKGFLHYTAEKTHKRARIKVPSETLQFIGWTPKRAKTDAYIFPSPKNCVNHVSRQAVWSNIKKACVRAGVNPGGVSPHSCRKHFARELFESDGLGATMSALQHSSPSTTFLYIYGEDPVSVFERRISKLEKAIAELRYAVELCVDRLIGDDTVHLTEEYKNSLQK